MQSFLGEIRKVETNNHACAHIISLTAKTSFVLFLDILGYIVVLFSFYKSLPFQSLIECTLLIPNVTSLNILDKIFYYVI